MPKRATSMDVAKQAGVSQSTVSRVFSDNSPNVSKKTRARVLAVAEELGYRPNLLGRMMSTKQTGIVGVVMGHITSPFYPYVLEKILSYLQHAGKQALVFTANETQDVDDILPLILQYPVDGLIITSATLSSAMAYEFHQRGTPVILFNRTIKDTPVGTVSADNKLGGMQIADLFLDTNHQYIAYMAGTKNTSTNRDRYFGFKSQLEARGYRDLIFMQSGYSYEAGYKSAQHLLHKYPHINAIFCANDIMAIGAIDALQQAGKRVPDEISIAGFDDIPMANWQAYQLTTIAQDLDAMILATIAQLDSASYDEFVTPKHETIAGKLIIRNSVKKQ